MVSPFTMFWVLQQMVKKNLLLDFSFTQHCNLCWQVHHSFPVETHAPTVCSFLALQLMLIFQKLISCFIAMTLHFAMLFWVLFELLNYFHNLYQVLSLHCVTIRIISSGPIGRLGKACTEIKINVHQNAYDWLLYIYWQQKRQWEGACPLLPALSLP